MIEKEVRWISSIEAGDRKGSKAASGRTEAKVKAERARQRKRRSTLVYKRQSTKASGDKAIRKRLTQRFESLIATKTRE